MANVEEQCETCLFWHGVNGQRGRESTIFCNYLLEMGRRRTEVNGVCESYLPKNSHRKRKRLR